MKKSIVFIASSAVIALAALYIINLYYKKKNGTPLFSASGVNDDITPRKSYMHTRQEVVLHRAQNMYPDEVELLQRYINLYSGYEAVPVTGIFDAATENAVNQITGKTSTTLYEFRFKWLINKNLSNEAERIKRGEY